MKAGNQVAGIPENMLVASADFTRNNFFGGISAKYVDDRFVYGDDRQGDFVLDSYTLVDLNVGVSGEAVSDSLSNVEFRLTVNNLTDESYLGTHFLNSGAWLGAPRTFVFTATADF